MPIKPTRPEAYTGKYPYIFLSYRRKDSETMEEILRCLVRNGYNVWYDEGTIPAKDWDDIIATHVEDCGFFIALVSQNYMQSRNCREELRFAYENEHPCLIIYMEPEAKLSPGMRMHLTGKEFLRLWEHKSVEDMLRRVARNPDFERCRDPEEEAEQTAAPTQAKTAPKTVTEEPKPQAPEPEPVKPSPPAARPSPAPKAVQAPSPVEDFEYKASADGVTITRYKGKGGAVVIRSEIGGKPVKEIGDGAFGECESVTSVTIPESVTRIGKWAFAWCSKLASVTIHDGVTSIGSYAFDRSILSSVFIPASVKEIEHGAFGRIPTLAEIAVDSRNRDFAAYDGVLYSRDGTLLHTFPAGKADRAYSVPGKVREIKADAFFGCVNLNSVTIPDGVRKLQAGVFYGCTTLVSVAIPASVTSIGYLAFYQCFNLRDVYYTGSRLQWHAIKIDNDDDGNAPLKNAAIHYDSPASP